MGRTEPFLALDRQLHEQAERLALAARSRDAELAASYVYELTDACVTCHARWAQHRFPPASPLPEPHRH